MRTGATRAADGATPAGDAQDGAPPRARAVLQPPLAVLLREGSRWFTDRLNEGAAAQGQPPLSAAVAVVLFHLDPRGSRPADVARSMGVSRQHVHAVIRELVDAGIAETTPDPLSRRDRLVVPTANGQVRRQSGIARMAALEAEVERAVGPGDLARLHDILTRMWNPQTPDPAPGALR